MSDFAVSRLSAGLFAFLFTALLATLTIGFLPPFWQTNDDVGMAMMVDGYGLAAYSSPGIVFSNVLYGYAIHALPYVADISRYSLVSLGLHIIAIFSICRSLCLLSRDIFLTFSITLLVAWSVIIFPQFTILSGVLSVAGILHILLYFDRKQPFELVFGGILLFLGYLIRSQEFYLILLVSGPVLLRKRLIFDRLSWMLLVVLVLLISIAILTDLWYYQASEWQVFRETNLLRAPFTDFGLASYFLSHQELLRGTPYSPNDIILLGSWFLADSSLLEPKSLSLLLSRVEASSFITVNFPNVLIGLSPLISSSLGFLFGAAAIAGILSKNRIRIGLSWIILVVIIIGLSLIGRPPEIRVLYAPLLLLLCLGAIQISQTFSRWLVIAAICLASLCTLDILAKRHAASVQGHSLAKRDLATIDKSKVYVVWGAVLHLESIFPVLGSLAAAREYRWYGLGVTSLAPFAMAHWNKAPGGLPAQLVTGEAVPFFASKGLIDLLSLYCEERHSAKLGIMNIQELRIGSIFTVTCRRPL